MVPALDGVEEKLHAGAHVADVGCEAGVGHVRRAAETPFNLVLEARR